MLPGAPCALVLVRTAASKGTTLKRVSGTASTKEHFMLIADLRKSAGCIILPTRRRPMGPMGKGIWRNSAYSSLGPRRVGRRDILVLFGALTDPKFGTPLKVLELKRVAQARRLTSSTFSPPFIVDATLSKSQPVQRRSLRSAASMVACQPGHLALRTLPSWA